MRTITAILSASSIYYTGVSGRRLGRVDRQLVLQPGQSKFYSNLFRYLKNQNQTRILIIFDWAQGKLYKCVPPSKTTVTRSSIMVWSSSTLWPRWWRPNSAGVKRTTSNWRNPRSMSRYSDHTNRFVIADSIFLTQLISTDFNRFEDLLKLAKIASWRSVSWILCRWAWPIVNSPSKVQDLFARKQSNTGEIGCRWLHFLKKIFDFKFCVSRVL